MQQEYANEVATTEQAEKDCKSDTDNYDAKVTECAALKSTWTQKKQDCDGKQDAMDAASCTVLDKSQDICTQYSDCYTSAAATYASDKASVQAEEASLFTEWKAILHLQCILDIFSKSTRSDSDLTSCNNKDFTSAARTALSLKYPSGRTAKTCTETAATAKSLDYETAEYSSLPSNAPAKTCVASCCAKCINYDCTSSYRLKPDTIFGKTSSECCMSWLSWTTLFVAKGTTTTYQNKWSGWYSGGNTVSSGEGKRSDYDSKKIMYVRFEERILVLFGVLGSAFFNSLVLFVSGCFVNPGMAVGPTSSSTSPRHCWT